MSAYGYRQHILETASSRTVISTGDTISISLLLDTITTNGLVLLPTSITFTATTTGIFSNIPAANITWKNGSTVLGTGALYLLNNDNYGFNALASSGSYTITATAVVNPGALTPVSKIATKTITLSSNNISANISPATALYTTDSSGNGTANIQLTMNILAGIDSVASGWLYAWSGATFSDGINTLQTVTVTGIDSDTVTITCLATKDGYSISKTAVISKSKTGTQGPGGASVKLIYLRSATAPTISPNTTTDPEIPASWSTTVPAAGAGYIYVLTGSKPSEDTTWTWGTPVLMEGQPGVNGKKVLSGYVYWSSTSAGQSGPALSSAVYNFTNNTFDSLNGWSQEIVFNASGTNLTKYFTVTETTAGGGTGTATFGNAYTHTSFDGLVTFTSLGGDGSTTFIDGGKITSGTITGRIINTALLGARVEMENPDSSKPHTFTGYTASGTQAFRLSANASNNSLNATLNIAASGLQGFAIEATGPVYAQSAAGSSYGTLGTGSYGLNAHGSTVGVQGTTDAGVGNGVYGANYLNGSGVAGVSTLGFGGQFTGGAGVYATASASGASGAEIHGGSSGLAVYAAGYGGGNAFYGVSGNGTLQAGLWLPFTGLHEVLAPTLISASEGDILIDSDIIAHKDISNTLLIVSISSTLNQKGAIGILNGTFKSFTVDDMPCNLGEASHPFGPQLMLYKITDPILYTYYSNYYLSNPTYMDIQNNYLAGLVNSLGEGQINVCGENGDLYIGDLIVTSSLPGKGMKQADDIVRSYTVAKCRENVTFSSPTETKMVACIYLCG